MASDRSVLAPDLGSNALKMPPFDMGAFWSGLMPNVAQIELFEASSGSIILRVFGTKTHFSSFCSSAGCASLECLPSVGEALPEQLLLVEDEGDRQSLDPAKEMFPVPAPQMGMQPQYEGGTSCRGMVGAQKPGTASIGLEHH